MIDEKIKQTLDDRIQEGDFRNVYLDTANGALFAYPHVFETVVAKVSADRILFGTDVPITRATRARAQVAEISGMGISSDEKADILGLNAERLLRGADVAI